MRFSGASNLRELTLGADFKFGGEPGLRDLPIDQRWLASDSKRYDTEELVDLTEQTGWAGGTFIVVTDRVVYFDGNGATSGSVDSYVGFEGDEITLPDNGFVRQRYEFAGWSTSPDGTGTVLEPGESFVIPFSNVTDIARAAAAGDVVFFAQWVEADDSGDGGSDNGADNGGSTLAVTGASSLGVLGGLAVVLTAAGVFLVRSNRKNLNRI